MNLYRYINRFHIFEPCELFALAWVESLSEIIYAASLILEIASADCIKSWYLEPTILRSSDCFPSASALKEYTSLRKSGIVRVFNKSSAEVNIF